MGNPMSSGVTRGAIASFLAAAVGAGILGAGPTVAAVDTRLCSKGDYAPGPNPVYPLQGLLAVGAPETGTAAGRQVARSVQEALWMGYYTNRAGRPIVIDGIYGPETAYAVRAFQRRHNLVVDGKVGPQTWRALARATCEGSTKRWSRTQGRSSSGENVILLRKKRRLTIVWWELAAYAVRKPGSTTKCRAHFGGEGIGGLANLTVSPTSKGFRVRVKRKRGSQMSSFTATYRRVPYTGKLL